MTIAFVALTVLVVVAAFVIADLEGVVAPAVVSDAVVVAFVFTLIYFSSSSPRTSKPAFSR